MLKIKVSNLELFAEISWEDSYLFSYEIVSLINLLLLCKHSFTFLTNFVIFLFLFYFKKILKKLIEVKMNRLAIKSE